MAETGVVGAVEAGEAGLLENMSDTGDGVMVDGETSSSLGRGGSGLLPRRVGHVCNNRRSSDIKP